MVIAKHKIENAPNLSALKRQSLDASIAQNIRMPLMKQCMM
jgi:hypothetical protein